MGNSMAALEANLVRPFRDGLRELGYEEGRNIVIEYRWADGNYERFPALVAELLAVPVDVIVTAGTPATLAVKKATSSRNTPATIMRCDLADTRRARARRTADDPHIS